MLQSPVLHTQPSVTVRPAFKLQAWRNHNWGQPHEWLATQLQPNPHLLVSCSLWPPGGAWCSTATPGSLGVSPKAGAGGAPKRTRGSRRTPQGSSRAAGGCAAACCSSTSVKSPAPVRSRALMRGSEEKVCRSAAAAAIRSHSSLSAGWPGAPANTHWASCRCRTYLQAVQAAARVMIPIV